MKGCIIGALPILDTMELVKVGRAVESYFLSYMLCCRWYARPLHGEKPG